MKILLSILLFIFTLLLLPILIVINIISPNNSSKIRNALYRLETRIKGGEDRKECQANIKEFSVSPSYKEPNHQHWNQVPDFEVDDEEILDDLDLAGFRYLLDYKDKYGNVTTRGVDITGVHKEYGNNRWYFIASTIDGERTFKSQRVISLKDQWFNTRYNSAKTIREHLLSNYDVIEDVD